MENKQDIFIGVGFIRVKQLVGRSPSTQVGVSLDSAGLREQHR